MVFSNNPHAAQAILESKQDRLHSQIATGEQHSPLATLARRPSPRSPRPNPQPKLL